MSTSPETDFDLEKLFLPAWAQESPSVNRYAKHSGDDRPDRRFDDRRGGGGGRPQGRGGPGAGGRGPGQGQGRPGGGFGGGQGRPSGPRREGDRGQSGRGP